ncbi:MAG TPA: twin-arginine translocation signal domain-containing protein, partial [Thermoanaerobaculia bacterium]
MGDFERLTTYALLKAHGVDRRTFLRFCSATAAALGLEAS